MREDQRLKREIVELKKQIQLLQKTKGPNEEVRGFANVLLMCWELKREIQLLQKTKGPDEVVLHI